MRPNWENECVNKSALIEWLRPYLHTGEPIPADVLISDIQMMPPTLTQQNEPLTPCDVCMYNPPSSMGGKPCCICPASPPVRDCEIMEYVETCEECGFCDGTSPERQEDT